jgi:hypothetical protein
VCIFFCVECIYELFRVFRGITIFPGRGGGGSETAGAQLELVWAD